MFFISEVSDTEFYVDAEETRHITKVLRKTVGDSIEITNGRGDLYIANIISVEKRQCLVAVTDKTFHPNSSPELCMAVAPTKNMDRYEWFVEKAVEIGIRRIIPIICDHSERTVINRERLMKIAISAMKQSKSYYLPEIVEQMSFDSCVNALSVDGFLAYCPTEPAAYISKVTDASRPAMIFIGPEGDFSPREYQLSQEKSIQTISLGPSRLRTETAAVYACSIFQSLFQHNSERT